MAGNGPIDKAEQQKRTMAVAAILGTVILAFVITGGTDDDLVATDSAAAVADPQPEVAALPPLRGLDIHDDLDYPLDVVASEKRVPPVFLGQIDVDLDRIRDVDEKKETFFRILLPPIAQENDRIRELRQRIIDDPEAISGDVYDSYDVEFGDIDTLLTNVDIIPTSLVLAKAALESGWGTSRFARQGNNFFGMRTYNPDRAGMAPKEAEGFKVMTFRNIAHSVRVYLKNINTHDAYTELRKARADMRNNGGTPDGVGLTEYLTAYSEIPEQYGGRLRSIISVNDLTRFDGVRLAEN